jgi:hypothetical protein
VEEAPDNLKAQTGCWFVVKAQVASKVSTGLTSLETGICVVYCLFYWTETLEKDPPTKLKNGECTAYGTFGSTKKGAPDFQSVRKSSETDCTRIGVFAYKLTNRVPEIRVMGTILPCPSIVTLKAEYTILYARDHYI